jgi:hypothetical protein
VHAISTNPRSIAPNPDWVFGRDNRSPRTIGSCAEIDTFQAEIRLRCTSDIKLRRNTLHDQVALANLSRN